MERRFAIAYYTNPYPLKAEIATIRLPVINQLPMMVVTNKYDVIDTIWH